MDIVALLLFASLVLPTLYVTILVHEIGHYTAFRVQNIAPQYVNIGIGRMLFKLQFKGTWFHFKLIPLAGEVAASPGHFKKVGLWGAMFVLLAGPLFQLVFAGGIGFFASILTQFPKLQDVVWILCATTTISAFIQLFPFKKITIRDGQEHEFRSDGFMIRNFWKRREQFRTAKTSW